MKILNVSIDDYSNFAFDNAQALNAVGHQCISLVLNTHRFNYLNTSRAVTKRQLVETMVKADLVQLFHSPIQLVPLIAAYHKPVVVYYTGTSYRQDPKTSHRAFDSMASVTVCALPELYLEALKHVKDPVYMVGGISIPDQVSFETPDTIRIAHYPSNARIKGTEILRPLFKELSKKCYTHISTDVVNYVRQLNRIDSCDIYVEMMATKQGDRDYGSFGITALEAAARGKIVATNCVHDEVYTQHYGESPFLFCNSIQELKRVLTELIESGKVEEIKRSLHKLFKARHSYRSTGKYIQDNVLSRLS